MLQLGIAKPVRTVGIPRAARALTTGSDAPQNRDAAGQGQDMVEHGDGTPPPFGPAHIAFAGELRQEIFDGLHRADTQCRRQFAQRGGIPATGQGTVNDLQ